MLSRSSYRRGVLTAATFVSLCGLWTTGASAHISLEKAGTHVSRDGDANLKAGPCGKAGSKRGKNIYTYEPGSTIKISVIETIPHPGYFRIAFDNDGDDGFKEPASIKPVDPNRKCPNGPGDFCGKSDFYNNSAVLPGMDNLNPHIPKTGDYINGPKYTWDVKLPDVECNNCTLQIIQVMEDDATHGPYDPTPGVGVEDIYHQCIDIVLKRGAGTGGSSTGGTATGGAATGGTDGSATSGGTGATDTGASSSVDGSTHDGMHGADDATGGLPTEATGGVSMGPATPGSTNSTGSDAGGCAVAARARSSSAGYGFSLVMLGVSIFAVRRRFRARGAR